MKSLLNKEFKLAASPLAFIFLAFSLLTLLPGYPILCGAFFMGLGLFQSFQYSREANDTLYTVLLPVKKSDFVAAKYTFSCTIEMIGFVLCAALTVVRMTVLSGAGPYIRNALMNASPLFLAFTLLIFTAFNVFFIGGFFRTGYKMGIPFLLYGIAAGVIILLAETLHHLPGLAFLNTPSGERVGLQLVCLAAAAVIYAGATALSCRRSKTRFENIDL